MGFCYIYAFLLGWAAAAGSGGGDYSCKYKDSHDVYIYCNDVPAEDSTCRSTKWMYGVTNNGVLTTDHGENWDCRSCAVNGEYTSPINIKKSEVQTSADYAKYKGKPLKDVYFSMPKKYGYNKDHTGSFKVKNSNGLTIYMPDGNYNKDDMSYANFQVFGGGLPKNSRFCIKKVTLKWKWDYDLEDLNNPGHPDLAQPGGSEHTIDGNHAHMEATFWAMNCDMDSWDLAVNDPGQDKIAAFSTLFTATEDEGEGEMSYSLAKLIKFYVKNAKEDTASDDTAGDGTGGRRLAGAAPAEKEPNYDHQQIKDHALACPGSYEVMEKSDYLGDNDIYFHVHELLPPSKYWGAFYFYKGGFTNPEEGCLDNRVLWHVFQKKPKINHGLLKYLSKYIFTGRDENEKCTKGGKKGYYRSIQNPDSGDYQPDVYKFSPAVRVGPLMLPLALILVAFFV